MNLYIAFIIRLPLENDYKESYYSFLSVCRVIFAQTLQIYFANIK